jgi:hypothetical protein
MRCLWTFKNLLGAFCTSKVLLYLSASCLWPSVAALYVGLAAGEERKHSVHWSCLFYYICISILHYNFRGRPDFRLLSYFTVPATVHGSSPPSNNNGSSWNSTYPPRTVTGLIKQYLLPGKNSNGFRKNIEQYAPSTVSPVWTV